MPSYCAIMLVKVSWLSCSRIMALSTVYAKSGKAVYSGMRIRGAALPVRRFERAAQIHRLVDASLEFALRRGVRHDAAARLNVRNAVLHDHGAQRDT